MAELGDFIKYPEKALEKGEISSFMSLSSTASANAELLPTATAVGYKYTVIFDDF